MTRRSPNLNLPYGMIPNRPGKLRRRPEELPFRRRPFREMSRNTRPFPSQRRINRFRDFPPPRQRPDEHNEATSKLLELEMKDDDKVKEILENDDEFPWLEQRPRKRGSIRSQFDDIGGNPFLKEEHEEFPRQFFERPPRGPAAKKKPSKRKNKRKKTNNTSGPSEPKTYLAKKPHRDLDINAGIPPRFKEPQQSNNPRRPFTRPSFALGRNPQIPAANQGFSPPTNVQKGFKPHFSPSLKFSLEVEEEPEPEDELVDDILISDEEYERLAASLENRKRPFRRPPSFAVGGGPSRPFSPRRPQTTPRPIPTPGPEDFPTPPPGPPRLPPTHPTHPPLPTPITHPPEHFQMNYPIEHDSEAFFYEDEQPATRKPAYTYRRSSPPRQRDFYESDIPGYHRDALSNHRLRPTEGKRSESMDLGREEASDEEGFFQMPESFPSLQSLGAGFESMKIRTKRSADDMMTQERRFIPRRQQQHNYGHRNFHIPRPRHQQKKQREHYRRQGDFGFQPGFWEEVETEFFSPDSPQFGLRSQPYARRSQRRPTYQKTSSIHGRTRQQDPYPLQSVQSYPPVKNDFTSYKSEKDDEDSEILGSGNFEVIRGGTFYDEDTYYQTRYNTRPQTQNSYGGDFFENFRDFADIKGDLYRYKY